MMESAPGETPVICQVRVFVPAKSVPTLIVGVATEKRPLADFSVTETLDRLVYLAALTWFSMLTVTVWFHLGSRSLVSGLWGPPPICPSIDCMSYGMGCMDSRILRTPVKQGLRLRWQWQPRALVLKCEFILMTGFGVNDYYKRHNYKLLCEKNRIHLKSFLCKGSLKSTRAVFAEE